MYNNWLVVLLQILTLAIQGYLVYLTRRKLGVEIFRDVTQKLKLSIRPRIADNEEEIEIVNEGNLVINKCKIMFNVSIEHGGELDSPTSSWVIERNEVTNPKDKVVVRLHERLSELLTKKKLLLIHTPEIPTGERDMYGEYIMAEVRVKHILKEFTIHLSIKATCTIYKEQVSMNRKFDLHYLFSPELFKVPPKDFEYEDNYSIEVKEVMGEWVE